MDKIKETMTQLLEELQKLSPEELQEVKKDWLEELKIQGVTPQTYCLCESLVDHVISEKGGM